MAKHKKFKLQRDNKYANKRFARIYIGSGIAYILVFGTIFLVSSLKLNKVIKEYEETATFYNYDEIIYAKESDNETRIIIEACNDYLSDEKANLEKAINYLNSEEYLMEINGTHSQYNKSVEIKELSNNQLDEISEEEYYIKLYCDIYQIDYDKVYNRLAELTDNFKSEEYVSGHVPGVTFKKKIIYFDSTEATLLAAVRCCAQLPEQMGLSNINTGNEYDIGMTIEQQVSYFADVIGVDKALGYSIIRSETSLENYSNNNMGNLKSNSGGWMKFGNVTQSIIEICAEIKKFNLDGRYTIEEIGEAYAPVEDNNENWIPNVRDSYQTAVVNYDELFSLEGVSLGR